MTEDEIGSIPLFHDTPGPGRAELGALADRVALPAGKVLTEQGALAHEFFVIEAGLVQVIRNDTVVATLGPGEFFGEIGLAGNPHRTASVVAVTDVELVVMGRREFHSMLSRFPEIASAILLSAARRVAGDLRNEQAA